jgi:hypothetical protein
VRSGLSGLSFVMNQWHLSLAAGKQRSELRITPSREIHRAHRRQPNQAAANHADIYTDL